MSIFDSINDERYAMIKEVIKQKGYNISYKDFTVSEIKFIISETPLSDIDKDIALMKYVNNYSNVDIYYKLNFNSKLTIDNRIKKISRRLKETCMKLFP